MCFVDFENELVFTMEDHEKKWYTIQISLYDTVCCNQWSRKYRMV